MSDRPRRFRLRAFASAAVVLLGPVLIDAMLPGPGGDGGPWTADARAESGHGEGGDGHDSDGGGSGGSDDDSDHSGPGSGGDDDGGDSSGHGSGDDDSGDDGHGSGGDDDDSGDDGETGGSDDDDDSRDERSEENVGDDDSRAAEDRGGRRDEVAGEVIVLNQDLSFFEEVGELGFRIIAQQPLGALGVTVTRLAIPAALSPAAARHLLRERYPTLLADSNGLYRPQASLSLPAPEYPERLIGWGPHRAECGRGIAIGLIDTGVAEGHPMLAERAIERRSFLAPDESPASPEHGTAIAGILVGRGGGGVPPGLLPRATLRLAETFLTDPAGLPSANVVAVATALDWLVQRQTAVIGLSLAGPDNLLLAIAVKRAAARGAVLVAAAGNGGADGPAAFPAAYPEVLAVAAVDQDLAPYAAGTRGDYIDLAAPGVQVAVAAPADGVSLVSGSSFAVPFVAAAAAVRITNGIRPDVEVVRQALTADARDLGPPGRDPIYGWGLLQSSPECRSDPAG